MRLQQLEDDCFRFPDLNRVLYYFHKKSRGVAFGQTKSAAGFYSASGRRYVIMGTIQLHRKELEHMKEWEKKRLPVGIESFEKIRI